MGPETQRDEQIQINFVKILSGNLILEYLTVYYFSLWLNEILESQVCQCKVLMMHFAVDIYNHFEMILTSVIPCD